MEEAKERGKTGKDLGCHPGFGFKEHKKKIPCYVAAKQKHNRSDPNLTAPELSFQIRAPVF